MKRGQASSETAPLKKRKERPFFTSVFGPFRREYTYIPPSVSPDFQHQLVNLQSPLLEIIHDGLLDLGALSFQVCFEVVFENPGSEEVTDTYLWLPRHYIMAEEEIQSAILTALETAGQRIEQFEARGSGWIYCAISKVDVKVSKYRPLHGASSFLTTPPVLLAKKAVVNVVNQDSQCFKWAMLSAIHPPQHHPHRIQHYLPFENELRFDDIQFPVPLQKSIFQKITELNPNHPFNVFIWNQERGKSWEVIPYFLNPINPNEAIDLLFIPGETEGGHYVHIRHMSRVIYGLNKDKTKKYICRRCFCHFYSQRLLNQHYEDCSLQPMTRKVFPKCKECDDFNPECEACASAATFQFKNFKTQQTLPVFLVADFESYLVPIHQRAGDSTVKTQKHVAASYGIKVVVSPKYKHLPCFQQLVSMPMIMETAEDLDNNNLSHSFLTNLYELGQSIQDTIQGQQNPISWSFEDQRRFRQETSCHICGSPFQENDVKCADHDHLLPVNNYRGAAHQDCNVNFNLKGAKIPCLLHNFKGYDSKLILKDVGRVDPSITKDISVIAQSSEQFKTVSMRPVSLLDSMSHLPCSLSTLVENLKRNQGAVLREVFPSMSEAFPDDAQFQALLRKGVFPYRFMDSPQTLMSDQLPPKDVFEDYEHALHVWNLFNMQSFREYMELYLKSDILLLADVMINYQELTHRHYGLDPFFFLTAPSLSLAAAMKMTRTKIDLITDVNMFNFVGKSIHGGLSYIGHRRAERGDNSSILYADA